jgi:hypothetical protein
MIALKSRFDGQKIEVPVELRGKDPADVVVVYDDRSRKAKNGAGGTPPSIWDFFGKSNVQRSAGDIERQVREERDSWGQR